jgi:hypothetical protein
MPEKTDTKSLPNDPPYLLQFLLSVMLSVLCGATIMVMWNWFITPLGPPTIGLIQALGIDTLVTFITTTHISSIPDPFWERWTPSMIYALSTLFVGWIIHFFM